MSLKAFEGQIAGHTEATPGSENIPRFLQSDNGFVFKPVTGKRGKREVEFYEQANSYDDEFKKYLAAFDKVIKHGSHEYMGIEDLTYPYHKDHVNVADIKMGTRTYDSSASAEKIQLEMAKSAKTTTSTLGIRFCGAKLINPANGQHLKLDKDWGKALTKDNILKEGLQTMFSCGGDNLMKDIVAAYTLKLKDLLAWFCKKNRSMAFYSSSLLFVFGKVIDAHKSHHNVTMVTDTHGISLKMIDFAHVDPLGNKTDENYIVGLENLIGLLEQLLKV